MEAIWPFKLNILFSYLILKFDSPNSVKSDCKSDDLIGGLDKCLHFPGNIIVFVTHSAHFQDCHLNLLLN